MGVLGVGTDLVDVLRIEQSISKQGARFAQRILSENECSEYEHAKRKDVFLAKRFAIKEAVAKALGTGFSEGVSWRDIELSHDTLGRPLAHLCGGALSRFEVLGAESLHVSLSDEGHLVSAFAVLSD